MKTSNCYKHIIILIIFFFIISGCTTITYNVPFVDSKETVNLTAGISKNDVLKVMGQHPLYVEYGDNNSGEIFWVYEVRIKEVRSENLESITGISTSPNKTHTDIRYDGVVHKLRLVFKNDELILWEPWYDLAAVDTGEEIKESKGETDPKDTVYVVILDDQSTPTKETIQKPKEKIKKKRNWFFYFHPKTGYSSNNHKERIRDWDSIFYRTDLNSNSKQAATATSIDIGFLVGWQTLKTRLGFEAYFPFRKGGMLIYEKLDIIFGLSVMAGIGSVTYDVKADEYIDEIKRFTKIAVGRGFNIAGYNTTARLEFLRGNINSGIGISISYHL